MPRSDKSERARAALESLFSGGAGSGAPASARSNDPFSGETPEMLAVGSGFRRTVVVSTRVELRGYPSADALMKRMAEAWGIEWTSVDNIRASALLPVGWTSRASDDVTSIVDAKNRVRATSSLQGGDLSYLKVLPRYFIEARKGLAWRAADEDDALSYVGYVMDRENSAEIHTESSASSEAALRHANAELKKWLDDQYPNHRDPFAYWTDCNGR
ncbi:nitroreductase [Burkholderia stagnalis]